MWEKKYGTMGSSRGERSRKRREEFVFMTHFTIPFYEVLAYISGSTVPLQGKKFFVIASPPDSPSDVLDFKVPDLLSL